MNGYKRWNEALSYAVTLEMRCKTHELTGGNQEDFYVDAVISPDEILHQEIERVESFLNRCEGKLALSLLRVANRKIVFVSTFDHEEICYLDASGFCVANVGQHDPWIKFTTATEAVKRAVSFGHHQADQVLAFIDLMLTEIADEFLRSSHPVVAK